LRVQGGWDAYPVLRKSRTFLFTAVSAERTEKAHDKKPCENRGTGLPICRFVGENEGRGRNWSIWESRFDENGAGGWKKRLRGQGSTTQGMRKDAKKFKSFVERDRKGDLRQGKGQKKTAYRKQMLRDNQLEGGAEIREAESFDIRGHEWGKVVRKKSGGI